jgi:hypothetical protein
MPGPGTTAPVSMQAENPIEELTLPSPPKASPLKKILVSLVMIALLAGGAAAFFYLPPTYGFEGDAVNQDNWLSAFDNSALLQCYAEDRRIDFHRRIVTFELAQTKGAAICRCT